MSWVLLAASFPGVGVRWERDQHLHVPLMNITLHHIPEERLTRITDRIVCKINKIDLVIVILSNLVLFF
jgi:hypothetical protein